MTAANTLRANGFIEFAASAVGRPHVWQGKDFGQTIEAGDSLETVLQKGGLDWRVQRAEVRYATGRDQGADQWATDKGNHVLMRSDSKAMLGIVSAAYKVHQPRDIVATLKHDANEAGFELETLGSLHGGSRIFASASDGQEGEIGKGDRVLKRTLLTTALDGTGATLGKETTICVVCANTLAMAMADGVKGFRQSHRSKYDAIKMRQALGLVHNEAGFNSFLDGARRLADRQVSKDRAELLLVQLLAPEVAAAAKTGAASAEQIEKVTDSAAFRRIMALFGGEGMGATMDGRKGTAWGWLNAVTEYADHHVRATSDDNRRESAWFGLGDKLKQSAVAVLAL